MQLIKIIFIMKAISNISEYIIKEIKNYIIRIIINIS
jgi:hypothetical protein